MENGELIQILKKYPYDMTVKFRHKSITIADIDSVEISSFSSGPSEANEEVILLENEELKKEGYR